MEKLEEVEKELALAEKMEKAGAEGADEEQCALALYNSMSKNEKAKAWSKYQVALKKQTDTPTKYRVHLHLLLTQDMTPDVASYWDEQ